VLALEGDSGLLDMALNMELYLDSLHLQGSTSLAEQKTHPQEGIIQNTVSWALPSILHIRKRTAIEVQTPKTF